MFSFTKNYRYGGGVCFAQPFPKRARNKAEQLQSALLVYRVLLQCERSSLQRGQQTIEAIVSEQVNPMPPS
jgi:hypothetical protein